ncbi:MAG: dephospho-CoA kinase [Prevotella sp.]|nr:dephospho-CoA kinase [Prevotella sp.]
MKIAVTGGIGSGKSYACRHLAERGIRVYDCDAAAKRLMRTSATLQEKLRELVGEEVYHDGQLVKPVMAAFLLASEENQKAVNAIVHPAVADDFKASGYDWMECAILFESGFDHLVDCVICVTAPEEVRIQRVMARDGLTRERALDWLAKQFPQEEVRRRSDYEIVNDGLQDISPQIDTIIQQINNKTKMQQTILSIAGKPGLYKLVSRGKMNLIVEALDETHKRMPAFATDRVTSLADIAMYTDAEDVPLMTILASLRDKEEGKEVSFNIKKASSKELRDYFAQVLPDFDRDRVHDSDIKKLLTWYNILVRNGITDFEESMSPTEGDNVDDRK